MSGPGAPQPLYLDGPNGALFAAWHRPADGGDATVLYLPPFAEELNRSRRTIAALGRALSARGLGLFVLDLYGTGDSAGGFEEAQWPGWLADADAAIRFITAAGHRVAGTMGLRTGAMLALATAHAHGLGRAVLCQPVESGRAYLTSLLRSRAAAAQTDDGARVTVAELRASLAAGSPVELMGYPLSASLAAGLEAADLIEAGSGFAGQVDWLRLVPKPTDAPPQRTADDIRRLADAVAGRLVDRAIEAPAFWLLEEPPPAVHFVSGTVSIWTDTTAREAA
jgi:exosortase A-associated hydrolase 2